LVYTLMSKVGQEEAVVLASDYLKFNDPWHIKHKHPFAMLVSSIDKVRIELNDPKRMLDSIDVNDQLREKYKELKEDDEERESRAEFDEILRQRAQEKKGEQNDTRILPRSNQEIEN